MAALSESWGSRGSNQERWMKKWMWCVGVEMVKKKDHSLMDVEAGTRIYHGTWNHRRHVSASYTDDNRTQKALRPVL